MALMWFLSLLLFSLLSPPISAKAALLMDGESGELLFEKSGYERLSPASTTKIATCLYALSRSPDLSRPITGTQESLGTGSEKMRQKKGHLHPAWRLERAADHMGVKVGEELPLKVLLQGMMISSACDASNLIAEAISGSIPAFMEEMNAYLKKLGCKATSFLNPHGLYHPKHLTTAYDLALMAREGLKNPLFSSFVSSTSFTRPSTNRQEPTTYLQTNRLIRRGKREYDPRAIGVKTGFTSESGYCLVAAARKGKKTLIAVILGAPTSEARYREASSLFDAGFGERLVKKESVKCPPSKKGSRTSGGKKTKSKPLKVHA